jgi:hypothetical protein
MATTKKASATKKGAKPKEELGKAALQLAVSVLRSDAVRDQLTHAPQAVVGWARERRDERSSEPRQDEPRADSVRRSSPADRFGQRGLERRIERVETAVTLAFGEREATSRPEVWTALDELKRSITIAGGLPILKRKRMHMRIDDALDELEVGLMNALLPKA